LHDKLHIYLILKQSALDKVTPVCAKGYRKIIPKIRELEYKRLSPKKYNSKWRLAEAGHEETT